MLPDAYQTDVSRATFAFLLARDRDEQARALRDGGHLLLTPQADGVLAVAAAMYRGHLAFGDRIEDLRLGLAEARHDGYDGKPRELACYLAAIEPAAQGPPALDHTDDDELTRAAVAVLLAFAGSRAWDERYRIAAAFSELFESGLPADLGQTLASRSVSDIGLASPQLWNGLVPILREVAAEGAGVLLGESLPDVFAPGWPSPLQPVIFEGDEQVQLLVLAFCEAPTWEDPVLAPRQWALWNHHLAGVLSDMGDPRLRAVGAEEAILRIRDALGVYGPADDPGRHLESLALYGRILVNRSRGDRASSLTTARECLDAARAGFAERGDVAQAAQAELDLAATLAALPRPPLREADLARALQHVTAAAQAFAQAKDSKSIFRAGVIQAEILLRYEQIFPRHDLTLELAIELLESVLEQLTGSAAGRPDPDELFTPSRLLAQAYLARSNRRREDRPPGTTAADDYAAAIACLRRCVDLTDRQSHPWMWAHGQDLLGTVYFQSGPDDAERLRLAAAHHEAALEVFAAALPVERRHTLVALSSAYFRLGRWADCRAVLAEATRLGDAREWLRLSEYGQFGEIEELQDAHERYAYALLRCGEPGQALTQLDLGKTRAQRDWHRATEGLPQLKPADPRPLVPAGGALVLPLVTPRGTAVWVLTNDPGEPPHGEVLELADVTESDLQRLLDGGDDTEGWFTAYARFRAALTSAGGTRGVRSGQGGRGAGPAGAGETATADEAMRAWDQAIDQAASELSGLLIEPISAVLRRKGVAAGADVVILPSKWLSILPLHAAWRRTSQGSRRYFGNEFTISYAPSLYTLGQAMQREAERGQADGTRAHVGAAPRRSLLAVCDPALAEAPAEVADVASHFSPSDTVVLSESSATVAAFLEQAPRFSHVHYACHGAFDESDPWDSALYLSEREKLTVGELVRASAFQSARLVTLSPRARAASATPSDCRSSSLAWQARSCGQAPRAC